MVLDRLPFKFKISLASVFALAMFMAFGALCWSLLKTQERRLEVDLAAQLHVLVSVQEGVQKLSEAHSALFLALSAVRTKAKKQIVDQAIKAHSDLAGESATYLMEKIDDEALDGAGQKLHQGQMQAMQLYFAAAKDVIRGLDVDPNLAEMSMQSGDQAYIVLARASRAFASQQKDLAEELRKEIVDAQKTALNAMVAALVASVLLTLAIGILVTRALHRQMATLVRAVSYAMEVLINHLFKLGARRENLEAKVFGGGNVLAGLTRANVGHRNAEFVLRYLNTEGIRIAARDLDDVFARKVYYFPATGRALVKRLNTLRNDTLLLRETDYRKKLVQAPAGGDIELFN